MDRQLNIMENFRLHMEHSTSNWLGQPINQPIDYYVGTSVDFLFAHLAAWLDKDLTFEDLGTIWKVGHRVPLNDFDMSHPFHRLMALHYTNLLPIRLGTEPPKLSPVSFQLELNRLERLIRI